MEGRESGAKEGKINVRKEQWMEDNVRMGGAIKEGRVRKKGGIVENEKEREGKI